LGYPSWAAYVTEDKMIGSDKAAGEFIEKIASAAGERSREDYEVLRKRAGVERVEAWDSEYLKERVRAEQLDFDSQSVRPYFDLGAVQNGIFETTARMFGIDYRKADVPVWHEDVTAWEIVEQGR